MISKKGILDDLIQVIFHRALTSSVGAKVGTLTSRAAPFVHPKNFLQGGGRGVGARKATWRNASGH